MRLENQHNEFLHLCHVSAQSVSISTSCSKKMLKNFIPKFEAGMSFPNNKIPVLGNMVRVMFAKKIIITQDLLKKTIPRCLPISSSTCVEYSSIVGLSKFKYFLVQYM